MGVAFVAAVVFQAAPGRPPGRRPAAPGGVWVGVVFSLAAGMTKLTYLATALAFAGLLALRDGWLACSHGGGWDGHFELRSVRFAGPGRDRTVLHRSDLGTMAALMWC